jgi:hypothetical protein
VLAGPLGKLRFTMCSVQYHIKVTAFSAGGLWQHSKPLLVLVEQLGRALVLCVCLQVLRYGQGQQYRVHMDTLHTEEGGPRVATVLMYLAGDALKRRALSASCSHSC